MNYIKRYEISLDDDTLEQNHGRREIIDATTIPKLEKLGFEGTDASLEISLLEYGMAWVKDGNDWHFIFMREQNVFDNGTWEVGTTWRQVAGWASHDDIDSFLSTMGASEEEFDSWPFPQQVYDLTNYWGWENIFGGCYYEGFHIFKDGRNRKSEYMDIVNGVNSF